MRYRIEGLSPAPFRPLFEMDEDELAALGVIRRVADAKPGFPCRITLEDAEPGERVLLLNHESHAALTPYRSSYAIFVRENAGEAGVFEDELPPVMRGRPLAFRHFDAEGMLLGASLVTDGDADRAIIAAFANPKTAYLDAHNAAHGCFAARVRRA